MAFTETCLSVTQKMFKQKKIKILIKYRYRLAENYIVYNIYWLKEIVQLYHKTNRKSA